MIWEFLKKGGPRDPKGYRGILRGLYRAPLRDYLGVILRNTHMLGSILESAVSGGPI